jgi:hypothetical protein
MLALIFAALHVEESLVDFKKGEAKGDEPLPGRGIVVRGIETGVRGIHFRLFSIVRQAGGKFKTGSLENSPEAKEAEAIKNRTEWAKERRPQKRSFLRRSMPRE